jgi:hypothetical protein
MPHGLILVLASLVAFSQSGCTAQAWYDAAKRRAENECVRQPPGAYEDCRARVIDQKYEEYEKARTGKTSK